MKKRNKILLAIIILFIFIGGTFLCINLFNKNKEKDDNRLKVEYYQKLHEKMYAYYKIMYKNIKVPEDKENSIIRINLGSLKREGFPMEDFVSFDGKHECDLGLSYATRKVVNSKYVINVYYKCGKDANYDYTKVKTKTNKANLSTTKKNSISKEEFDLNKPNNVTTTTEAINE